MKRWTQEEIESLKRDYPRRGAIGLVSRLGRTHRSIRRQAQKLGLKCEVNARRDLWTPRELEILREVYPLGGSAAASRVLNRSRATIQVRAGLVGIKYQGLAA